MRLCAVTKRDRALDVSHVNDLLNLLLQFIASQYYIAHFRMVPGTISDAGSEFCRRRFLHRWVVIIIVSIVTI